MGSSSGLIIAFVVVVWAAYVIPLVLRRYDEATKNASVETTGSLSRVINRASRQQAPEATATEPVPAAQTSPAASTVQASRPAARAADRPAARRAAARRRRTLLSLLLLTAVVGGVAAFGVIATYWIAAPVALVVAWLVACRVQVRGERGMAGAGRTRAVLRRIKLPKVDLSRADRAPRATAKIKAKSKTKRPQRAAASTSAAVEEDTIIVSGQFEDIDPGRKHVMEQTELEVDALDDKIVIAVPSISTSGEALWDPLPVTLPTYVTKPRAGRTVRTIDFSQPHTWTSGHIEGEDVELPKRADDASEHRRAVGD
ncbi:hypothetical protein [Aeromicrobium endophyticum]|uniref:Uncharacterized protein n=1 Tax=Aeromicrobium endophyticum TaxID=2292704 RepID=A0A371PEG6_9ACTN|nr:hypothetical protein [Aeromicrobium endophyticum]REK73898.1 hypothetical protein DX116_10400 [Aeromicrobium endophyticum]